MHDAWKITWEILILLPWKIPISTLWSFATLRWHTTKNTEMRNHRKPYASRGKARTKKLTLLWSYHRSKKECKDIHLARTENTWKRVNKLVKELYNRQRHPFLFLFQSCYWIWALLLSTIFRCFLTLCSAAGLYQCPNPLASPLTPHVPWVCEAHEACNKYKRKKFHALVIKTQIIES